MNDTTNDMPHVTIYTDGGSEPNPGPGGWGAILIAENGTEKEFSGAAPDTTNNRMELTAAIEALRALKQPCRVDFYTDSQYVRKGITEWLHGWVRRGWLLKSGHPVANVDLWQALHAETQRHAIEWHWVKGHAGNEYNERVDQLATAARRQLTGDTSPATATPGDPDASFAPQIEIALRVSVPKSGGAGGYAIRLVTCDTDAQDTITGRVARTPSSSHTLLIAAREALEHTPAGTAVRVYCPDNYLQQGITQWVAGWERRGWQTRDGSPVKHQDAWRALVGAAESRRVQWLNKAAEPDELAAGLDMLASQAARGEM